MRKDLTDQNIWSRIIINTKLNKIILNKHLIFSVTIKHKFSEADMNIFSKEDAIFMKIGQHVGTFTKSLLKCHLYNNVITFSIILLKIRLNYDLYYLYFL